MSNKMRYRLRGIRLAVALLGAFAGGWAFAGTLVATEIDTGLLQAFNSVGQNLFGSAVFGVEAPPNPIPPGTPVQLYFTDKPAIPVEINVLYPPNYPPSPCRVYARLRIGPDGTTLFVGPEVVNSDSTSMETLSSGQLDYSLNDVQPPVSGCNAPSDF